MSETRTQQLNEAIMENEDKYLTFALARQKVLPRMKKCRHGRMNQ
ncbi:MAG: hypothetical protein ACYS3N_04185 [Planctomycetota bacterium]|jgi:hypothetical protein